MEKYIIDMKEVADALEEIDVPLPQAIVVYYILQNLLKEYDITTKHVIYGKKETTRLPGT